MKSVEKYLLDPEEVSSELIELKDRSCRNNLRIDSMQEAPHETWDLCEEKIQNIIMKRLGIEGPIEIERCHRIQKKT